MVETPMESFQTQVLVSLAKIEGDIALIRVLEEGSSKRLDEHWQTIDRLKGSQAKTIGAATALALVLPIIVSILALFIQGGLNG